MSFPRVGGGAGNGGARVEPSVSWGFPSAHTTLLGGGVSSQIAGAEALRIGSELAPFPLSVCSPHPSTGTLAPQGERYWNKRGQYRSSVWVWMRSVVVLATVRACDRL